MNDDTRNTDPEQMDDDREQQAEDGDQQPNLAQGHAVEPEPVEGAVDSEGEATIEDISGELYMVAMLEALLFAAEEPLTEVAIADTLPDVIEAQVPPLIEALERRFVETQSGLTVQRAGGGWRLTTRAEYADVVRTHLRGKLKTRLSRAALETVSIIAYKQPISRGEIEEIRGVDPAPVLRTLLERELIRIHGRAEAPGRPLLYATTKSFLEYFGLDSLANLPRPEELLGDLEEEEGVAMPVRRGPFAGADSGVEDEVYRVDVLPRDEDQAPLPGTMDESEEEEGQAPLPRSGEEEDRDERPSPFLDNGEPFVPGGEGGEDAEKENGAEEEDEGEES